MKINSKRFSDCRRKSNIKEVEKMENLPVTSQILLLKRWKLLLERKLNSFRHLIKNALPTASTVDKANNRAKSP